MSACPIGTHAYAIISIAIINCHIGENLLLHLHIYTYIGTRTQTHLLQFPYFALLFLLFFFALLNIFFFNILDAHFRKRINAENKKKISTLSMYNRRFELRVFRD